MFLNPEEVLWHAEVQLVGNPQGPGDLRAQHLGQRAGCDSTAGGSEAATPAAATTARPSSAATSAQR
jgi:hypothetical protein